jgi:translocation and assembly module TamA
MLLLAFSLLVWAGTAEARERVTVELSGVDGEITSNVTAFLSIAQLQTRPRGLLESIPLIGEEEEAPAPISEDHVRRLHGRAEKEIRQALQPYGYYSPTIRTRLDRIEGDWVARYDIDPGPATVIRQLDLVILGPGLEDPDIRRAVSDVDLREGQRLMHGAYEDTKRSLVAAANNAGYLDARFTRREMRVSPAGFIIGETSALRSGADFFFVIERGD